MRFEEILEIGVGARYPYGSGRMAERPVIKILAYNALIPFIFGIIPAQPSVETS